MTVSGATLKKLLGQGPDSMLSQFIRAARRLERAGVLAITTSCGLLAPLQRELAQMVRVPVFASSLLQVPLVYAMTQRRVAILTADRSALTRGVLGSAGVADSLPLAIGGLQSCPAFRQAILQDGTSMPVDSIRQEVLAVARAMLLEQPEIGAFVLECHNLGPYSRALKAAFGLPVFDIISFAEWIYRSQCPPEAR